MNGGLRQQKGRSDPPLNDTAPTSPHAHVWALVQGLSRAPRSRRPRARYGCALSHGTPGWLAPYTSRLLETSSWRAFGGTLLFLMRICNWVPCGSASRMISYVLFGMSCQVSLLSVEYW